MHRWAGLGCSGNQTLCATGSADLNIAPSWDSRHLMLTTNTSFEGFCFKTICISTAQHTTRGVSVHEVYSAHTHGSTSIRGMCWLYKRREQSPVICFLTTRVSFARWLFREQPGEAQGQEPSSSHPAPGRASGARGCPWAQGCSSHGSRGVARATAGMPESRARVRQHCI